MSTLSTIAKFLTSSSSSPAPTPLRKLQTVLSNPSQAKAITTTTTTKDLIFFQTKKLTQLGRNGHLDLAKELFDEMPHRNQVTYNAMLSIFVNAGRLDSALQLFDAMPKRNAKSYTSMIAALSRSGSVGDAARLFESIPSSERNVFSWTAIITCYASNNEPLRALECFSSMYSKMFESNVLPNSHTFSALLKCCSSVRSIESARQVHGLSVKLSDERGGECSIFVLNALIDVNAKLGHLVDAERVFASMKYKDLTTWNSMMDAYRHHFLVDRALDLFSSMEEKDTLSWNIMMSGLSESRRGEEALALFLCLLRQGGDTSKPNASTYTVALSCCATLSMIEFGRQIHGITVKNGLYRRNVFVSNSVMTVYANGGMVDELERVFNEMPNRDVVSWNSMIQSLGRNGCARKALKIAEEALVSKNFNHNTFTAILTSCSHGGLVVEGMNYLESMSAKYGVEPSLDHYICAVDMIGRAGEVENAYKLVRETPVESSSVAWVTLLNACLIHGNDEIGSIAAERLRKLEPVSARSYLAMAGICSKTGRTAKLRRIRGLMGEMDLRKEEPGCSWVVEI